MPSSIADQGGCGLAGEVGEDRLVQEVEGGLVPLGAGGGGRPDAFAPALAGVAAGALGDFSVDDHEADRPLGEVVRRLNPRFPRGGDELEVGVAVLAETAGQVLRLGRPRRVFRG